MRKSSGWKVTGICRNIILLSVLFPLLMLSVPLSAGSVSSGVVIPGYRNAGEPPACITAETGRTLVLTKGALSFILCRPHGPEKLKKFPDIDAEAASALIERAMEENAEFAFFRHKKNISSLEFNDEVEMIQRESLGFIEDILGKKADRFFEWLATGWFKERKRAEGISKLQLRSTDSVGDETLTYTVFGTQYFGETNYEIALPDKFLKFANRGWSHEPGYEGNNYRAKLERSGWVLASVLVWDVGPWNIDDNYWNAVSGTPRPRRLFTDLDQGMPESQAAYYYGYNGGVDQYGRTVIVPSALDMTPDVAADIGLSYLQNDWITVTYLWEEGGGGGESYTVDDSDDDCRFYGPSEYWWEVYGYGQSGQMHYTWNISSGWTNAAVWKFNTSSAGDFDVSVFIPRNYASTTSARYYINTGSGWQGPFAVNQSIYYDEWVSLGTHWLRKGINRVAVIDGTGETAGTTKIGVDAVRITLLD